VQPAKSWLIKAGGLKLSKEFLMGIDIGTQSTRVAVLGLDGVVKGSASTAQELATPKPGWGEQDPDMWWANVAANIPLALEEAGIAPGQVLAVGVSGQMHATIPLDADGNLLSNAVQLWCDKRCSMQAQALAAHPEVKRLGALVGNPPLASWFGFKIRWLKENCPEIYRRTRWILQSSGYINYRLTGCMATDWTEASGSYLMNTQSHEWEDSAIQALEIDRDILPPIGISSEVLGQVTPTAAAATGLMEGTPVVHGAGDMLCMLIASGLTEPGRASDITGTASILAVHTDEPVPDPRLMNLHHALPGWIPFGIIDSGGGALKWFKDELCAAESARAAELRIEVYDILNQKAAQVEPGCEGLLFYPYLMGERSLGSPHARGVFFGLTPRSGVGAMTRAIMEGVTFELRRTLELVEDHGNRVGQIYTIGGGANSGLWSQIKADIYHKPVHTFESFEGGILGSAILAGVGAGVYADVRQGAQKCLRIDKSFQPRPETAGRYDGLFGLFKEVHDLMQEPFGRLSALS
jgi:xylulokinase